jgi:hypothetical protein
MWVEQAVFTSAQTRQVRGYHLVARSPGIPDALAQSLAVWGPTHDALLDDAIDSCSVNYFVAHDEWGVLSRTVYGPSEYSSRGGFRLETNLLVVRREQLSGYGHNPHPLFCTALALGHLRLRPSAPVTLKPVELPDMSLLADQPDGATNSLCAELTERIVRHLPDERVAVIGVPDPWIMLRHVIDQLPQDIRSTLSFTTGLKPSLRRPFTLQFLSSANRTIRHTLGSSGIVAIDADTL